MDDYCRKSIRQGNVDGALHHMRTNIAKVYKMSRKTKNTINCDNKLIMQAANAKFETLRSNTDVSPEVFEELLTEYQDSRNQISKDIYKRENECRNSLTNANDSKKLWGKIFWKGNASNKVFQPPIFEDMVSFFENLYTNDSNGTEKINQLTTDVYEPSLGNPITMDEMNDAMNNMKNGGYDHRIDMFKIIMKVTSPLVLLFLNTLFFVAYPIKLAISLLSAIPKTGDLSLPSNFRGIQMLPALAVLYDRVIALRLTAWMCVKAVQSAFQKGKSTLLQLFTIRLLIELAKKENITIYIGLFDLAKAFDKVSRYQMLKKLISQGIGNCMLQALKRPICTHIVY